MSTDRTILSLKFGPRALRSQTHAAFHRLINVDTRRKFSDFEEIGRRQGCLFLALPSFLRKFVIFAFSELNWTHSRRKERKKEWLRIGRFSSQTSPCDTQVGFRSQSSPRYPLFPFDRRLSDTGSGWSMISLC